MLFLPFEQRNLYFFKKIRPIFILFFLALATFCSPKEDLSFKELPDPFSPQPGVADSYDQAGADDNVPERANRLNLNGTRQLHNFHTKEDQDWYIFTATDDQRVILEVFELSNKEGSTILEVFFKDNNGDIYKFWGSDTGIIGTLYDDASLATKPLTKLEMACNSSYCLNVIDKKLKIHRKSSGGNKDFFVKVSIPPYKFKTKNANSYYIRTIGSGEYDLTGPANITASRDLYGDRISLSWNEASGATSYRVIRAPASINLTTLVCSSWPCAEANFGATLAAVQGTMLTEKTQQSYVYNFKTNSNTPFDLSDDTALANRPSVNGNVYSDKGSWQKSSSGVQMRCQSGPTIEDYKWARDPEGYRIVANSLQDTLDPEKKLPFTSENTNYYVNTTDCGQLPGDNNSADDPLIGNVYRYVVFACDDDLEYCVKQDNANEQANSAAANGGGSIKLNIGKPFLEYVSTNDDDNIWLAFKDVTSNKTSFTLTITNGGTQYSDTVAISISGGGGYGASATGTVSDGKLTGIAVTSGGANYGVRLTVDPNSTIGGVNGILEAKIINGVLKEVVIVNKGFGYGHNLTVPVKIEHAIGGCTLPSGTTGTISVTSENGELKTINGVGAGIGSACGPTIGITGVNGSGGAMAAITVQRDYISEINVTNQGSGYGPVITFTGGGGVNAKALAIVEGGQIKALNVIDYGTGYTSNPSVSIDGGKAPLGTLATVSAQIARKILRYSIRRSDTLGGPFNEVECQIDANSVEAQGLRLEADEAASKSRDYFYQVVAQQLPDTHACTGENCSATNARQGSIESDVAAGGDDNCANDLDYLTTAVSESEPSNVVSGHRNRLKNRAFDLTQTVTKQTVGIPAGQILANRIGYYTITNNLEEKSITLVNTDLVNFTTTTTTISLIANDGGVKTLSTLCTSISAVSSFSCTVNGALASYPATLLAEIKEPQLITTSYEETTRPGAASEYLYGNNSTPVRLENRAFASQGYHDAKVSLKWAPIGLSNYKIFRRQASSESIVPYISISYSGNAREAKIRITDTALTALAVDATDGSPSFTLDFGNEATNTVDEVVSYINRMVGFSAHKINPDYKVIEPQKIQDTVSTDDNYLNLREFNAKGLAKPVVISALAKAPLFSGNLYQQSIANDLDSSTVLLATQSGTSYDDVSAASNTDYFYTIVACDGTCTATDNTSYNFIAATGSRKPFAEAVNTLDKIGTGLAADNDEFDFNDPVIAAHAKSATVALGANYDPYIQNDNDFFPGKYPATAANDANVFALKLGVHESHPVKDFSGYNTLANASGTVRPNTFLPCSFHVPCADDGSGGNNKWYGDPDIIYDLNTTTGGDEPLRHVGLYFNSRHDVDWLWFFAQKKYYAFSNYSSYALEYLTASSDGCRALTVGGGGTDAQADSKPCSYNLSSGLASNNTNNLHTGRVFAKKYAIKFESADNSITEVIVDFYVAWPILEAYNALSNLPQKLTPSPTDNYIISPPLNTAPMYSLRLVKGQNTGDANIPNYVRVPSAKNMFQMRGLGLADWPTCNNGPDVNIPQIKTSYDNDSDPIYDNGPCIMGPVCTKTSGDNNVYDRTATNTNQCAKMPVRGLKLCDTEEIPISPKGIYTRSSDTAGNQHYACIPAPYYTDSVSDSNFYRGKTCSHADKRECPPPGAHFLLKVYSPNGEAGRNVKIQIEEQDDISPENTNFP